MKHSITKLTKKEAKECARFYKKDVSTQNYQIQSPQGNYWITKNKATAETLASFLDASDTALEIGISAIYALDK